MSTAFEAPAMHVRDMRSAKKEWKRSKDHASKWSFGARPLYGCRLDDVTGEATGGSESQRAKARPRRRGKGELLYKPPMKIEHNVNKLNRSNEPIPVRRFRSKMIAHDEIYDASRSIADLVPAPTFARSMSASDNFLYSFDRVDSPGQPLALDLFVKPANPRDTERLIQKEYEVLDANGQALKGRRARLDLRRAAFDPNPGTPDADEDEGFQLV